MFVLDYCAAKWDAIKENPAFLEQFTVIKYNYVTLYEVIGTRGGKMEMTPLTDDLIHPLMKWCIFWVSISRKMAAVQKWV